MKFIRELPQRVQKCSRGLNVFSIAVREISNDCMAHTGEMQPELVSTTRQWF